MDYQLEELQKKIESRLTEKRFLHTLGVCHTSACLAMCYGEDVKKAAIAGILHDCAKCMSEEEIKQECIKYHIEMSEIEERNPYLLHGKLGAFYAKEEYNINDEDILNAIIYHTTGHPNMTLLEKIVFIGDYIEAGRKDIPGLKNIRAMAFKNIDQAVYMTLNNTLNYLEDQLKLGKQVEIDPMTKKAYEYYQLKYITPNMEGIKG